MEEATPAELAALALELLRESYAEHSNSESHHCSGCWKEKMANELWRYAMKQFCEIQDTAQSADRIQKDMVTKIRQKVVPRLAISTNYAQMPPMKDVPVSIPVGQETGEVISLSGPHLAYLRERLQQRNSQIA